MTAYAPDQTRPPKQEPQIITGGDLAIIPFGGSLGNVDVMAGQSQEESPAKYFLTNAIFSDYFFATDFATGLPQVDSTQLVSGHLKLLAKAITETASEKIIVTAGTHKLTEIGRYLKGQLPEEVLKSKQIILTASYGMFENHPGDAKFNLGFAMSNRLSDKKGLYIAINADLYDPNETLILNESREVIYADPNIEAAMPSVSDTLLLSLGGTIERIELDIGAQMARGYCEKFVAEEIRPKRALLGHAIALKDSRKLQDLDVDKLIANIAATPYKNIVFTVGTWKAEEVLDKLHKSLELCEIIERDGKTILATCAMKMPGQEFSDAAFNLGYAIGAIPHLKPGFYLTIHGVIAEPGALVKKPELGRFEKAN